MLKDMCFPCYPKKINVPKRNQMRIILIIGLKYLSFMLKILNLLIKHVMYVFITATLFFPLLFKRERIDVVERLKYYEKRTFGSPPTTLYTRHTLH